MKLNIGCGNHYVQGWVNVDLPTTPHHKDVGIDITGELPWTPRSIECAYAGHVLEHVAYDDALQLLQRLRPLMKTRAPIMLVGPDIDRALKMFPADDVPDQYGVTLNLLRYGAGRWSGDVHLWECTEVKLMKLLDDAGWVKVTPMDMDTVKLTWPVADAQPRWQCAVGALSTAVGEW